MGAGFSRSVRAFAVVTAFAAFFLASAAPSGAATRVLVQDDLASAVTTRINGIRAAYGLRPLAFRWALKTAGTKHAANMAVAGYFSHSWSNGAPFGTWIRWYWPGPGYTSWSAGENIYWAYPSTSAAQVVRAWMNSSGHRANILRPGWTSIGVGAVHASTWRGHPSVTLVAAEFGYRRL